MSAATFTIAASCACGRRLAGMPKMGHATLVVRRTCRGCGQCWSVVAKPMGSLGGLTLHDVTLAPVRPKARKAAR